MVVGKVTISTCYGVTDIPVEILGNGPHPGTTWVKALGGLEPFTKISHGGPYQESTAVVGIPSLREVHLEMDPEEQQGLIEEPVVVVSLPNSIQCLPVEDRPIPVMEWGLEGVDTNCVQEVATSENRTAFP